MSRTFLRQDAQILPSLTYDDTVAAGSTLESSPVSIEDDLNGLRSQQKRYMWADEAGNWYDDVPTVNSKKRGISQLATHLDAVEEHKFCFRTQVLTDIAVPASVKATGVLTLTGNAANNETVVIGSKTYTFVTTLTPTEGEVLLGGSASDSIDNLIAAITHGAGYHTTYECAVANTDVTATAGAGDTMDAEALLGGSVKNLVATTTTLGSGSWGAATLTGGAGDVVVLSFADSETPTQAAAVGAGTYQGAIVPALGASEIGLAKTTEVAGVDALNPKNLCLVRDGTGEVIFSSDKIVYALIQVENGTVDGDAFDDSTHQAQLSFVRENATGNDLELVPAADIAGKTINYAYVRRLAFDSLPEMAFTSGVWLDQTASATELTLDRAIDNQGEAPATQITNTYWRINDTKGLYFQTSDGGVDLFKILPAVAGDEIELNVATLDINNVNDVDMSGGLKVDTGGTTINLGVTAGQIDSAGALVLASAAAGDLTIDASGEVIFDDTNKGGSTFSGLFKLADTAQEWSDFETRFGEVSLLNAIVQADKQSRSKTVARVSSDIAADANVTGAGGSPNIDAQLGDYSTVTFITDVDVYVNGELMRNGADASANHDVYPGTTPANGDLKFEFGLKTGTGNKADQITMIIYGI